MSFIIIFLHSYQVVKTIRLPDAVTTVDEEIGSLKTLVDHLGELLKQLTVQYDDASDAK